MNAVKERHGNKQQLNYISLLINIPLVSFSLETFHGWLCNKGACFPVIHYNRRYSVFVITRGYQLYFVFITFISKKLNGIQWMCLVNGVSCNNLFLECVPNYLSIMNAIQQCIKWIALHMVLIKYGQTNELFTKNIYLY